MALRFKLSTCSIQTRLLLTVFVGLLALAATHYLVDLFHKKYTYTEVEDRLRGYASAYGNMLVIDEKGVLDWSTSTPPDPRFNQERSGLYAVIYEGEQLIWASPSASVVTLPSTPIEGERSASGWFEKADPDRPLFTFNRFKMPVLVNRADTKPGPARVLNVVVYEDGSLTSIRVQTFSYAVWGAMWASFVLILFAQSIAARWSVKPFRALAKEVKLIQSGDQKHIATIYPKELHGVAESLNDLIDHQEHQKTTYRHSLGNLAHSLKTPLAVIRSVMDQPSSDVASLEREEVLRQLARMDDTISYQLSVAARMGRSSFALPIEIEPIANQLVLSLEKIHAQRGVLCEFEFEPEATVRADPGDVQELLGNLLENAFKWSASRVLLSVKKSENGLVITIEDDGPGVPKEKVDDILMRGVRADQRVQGHGIGLAIVDDILRAYNAKMSVGSSQELGGARFEVVWPE